MIDHIGIVVRDFEKARTFYKAALAPLGYGLLMEYDASVTGSTGVAGFGVAPKPDFWISQGTPPEKAIHVCFAATSRAQVDSFHQAALAAGGKDNGKPGLRPQYHAKYYGAFVLDLDGYNIEAVYHGG